LISQIKTFVVNAAWNQRPGKRVSKSAAVKDPTPLCPGYPMPLPGLIDKVAAILCVSTILLLEAVAIAQSSKPTAISTEPPKQQLQGDVKIPLIDQPLRLQDFLGMKPKPDLAAKLGKVEGFIQQNPVDGRPATQRTEVWLGHTRTVLYVVFVCFDDHPNLIRSHLARRENILKDDNVTLLLDTFEDRRRGLLFSVNPAGVQADAAWTEGSNPDYSFDTVWDSEGRQTSQGWVALAAIPFRSLRFRSTSAEWGAVLERNFPRNSEVDYWPRVSSSISGTLSQEGTLKGIEGVTGSHNIQVNPYTLGQNEHTLLNLDPLNPYFSSRMFEATAGGEVKAIVKDSIVLDATVNPDFSDVESNQPQFTINQRYPVYFPELRPFFLENANYFATPIQLLYTRNIIRPDFGGRLTGKVGNTNIGILAIDDREPGETVPLADPLHGRKAVFLVGRVAQDFGKNLTIGGIYTDEEFGGGWNRIGGLDFTWRTTPKWTVLGESVESSTKGSDPNSVATVFPTGYAAGPASYLEVDYAGHSFNMQSVNKDFSTGFQSQVGFIQTTDFRNDQTHATYQWYPKHSVVQSFGLEENAQIAFDHQGNRVYHYFGFDPFFLLPRNIVLAPLVGQNSDTLGPQNGYPLKGNVNFSENYGGFVARGAPWPQLNFNIVGLRSGNVNYNPTPGGDPSLMNQQTLQALVTIQPIRQLTADNTYLLDRDFSSHTGHFVYESQTFRTKINYQFTKAFSARVIVEYDSTLANPLETSLLRTKQVGTEVLLTWLPHPGTAIYVGYNNDIQNLDRTLCNQVPQGGCDPNNTVPPRSSNYLNDGRQIFIKASYLLRF
jgi:hypothetical protein